jgi:hypothetical protein
VGQFRFIMQIDAALAADSEASERAMKGWGMGMRNSRQPPVCVFSSTKPEIDLDAPPSPAR